MLITPLQPLRVEGPREATDVGVEFKGASVGVERRRGVSGLKPWPARRDAPGEKVLKERRSSRRRGRMGTSVRYNAPERDPVLFAYPVGAREVHVLADERRQAVQPVAPLMRYDTTWRDAIGQLDR